MLLAHYDHYTALKVFTMTSLPTVELKQSENFDRVSITPRKPPRGSRGPNRHPNGGSYFPPSSRTLAIRAAIRKKNEIIKEQHELLNEAYERKYRNPDSSESKTDDKTDLAPDFSIRNRSHTQEKSAKQRSERLSRITEVTKPLAPLSQVFQPKAKKKKKTVDIKLHKAKLRLHDSKSFDSIKNVNISDYAEIRLPTSSGTEHYYLRIAGQTPKQVLKLVNILWPNLILYDANMPSRGHNSDNLWLKPKLSGGSSISKNESKDALAEDEDMKIISPAPSPSLLANATKYYVQKLFSDPDYDPVEDDDCPSIFSNYVMDVVGEIVRHYSHYPFESRPYNFITSLDTDLDAITPFFEVNPDADVAGFLSTTPTTNPKLDVTTLVKSDSLRHISLLRYSDKHLKQLYLMYRYVCAYRLRYDRVNFCSTQKYTPFSVLERTVYCSHIATCSQNAGAVCNCCEPESSNYHNKRVAALNRLKIVHHLNPDVELSIDQNFKLQARGKLKGGGKTKRGGPSSRSITSRRNKNLVSKLPPNHASMDAEALNSHFEQQERKKTKPTTMVCSYSLNKMKCPIPGCRCFHLNFSEPNSSSSTSEPSSPSPSNQTLDLKHNPNLPSQSDADSKQDAKTDTKQEPLKYDTSCAKLEYKLSADPSSPQYCEDLAAVLFEIQDSLRGTDFILGPRYLSFHVFGEAPASLSTWVVPGHLIMAYHKTQPIGVPLEPFFKACPNLQPVRHLGPFTIYSPSDNLKLPISYCSTFLELEQIVTQSTQDRLYSLFAPGEREIERFFGYKTVFQPMWIDPHVLYSLTVDAVAARANFDETRGAALDSLLLNRAKFQPLPPDINLVTQYTVLAARLASCFSLNLRSSAKTSMLSPISATMRESAEHGTLKLRFASLVPYTSSMALHARLFALSLYVLVITGSNLMIGTILSLVVGGLGFHLFPIVVRSWPHSKLVLQSYRISYLPAILHFSFQQLSSSNLFLLIAGLTLYFYVAFFPPKPFEPDPHHAPSNLGWSYYDVSARHLGVHAKPPSKLTKEGTDVIDKTAKVWITNDNLKTPRESIVAVMPTFSSVVPIVFSSSTDNMYVAVCNRALQTTECDTTFSDEMNTIIATEMRDLITSETFTPVVPDVEAWLASQPPVKQRKYRACLAEWQISPYLRKNIYDRSIFNKRELSRNVTPTDDYSSAPRVICGGSDHLNIAIGPFCSAASKLLQKKWDDSYPITYASGKDSAAVGSWFAKCASIPGVKCFENDFSKFDASITVPMLRNEHAVYRAMGCQNILAFDGLSVDQHLENIYTTRGYGLGVGFSVQGTRRSGDMHTTLGNSLLNGLATALYFRRVHNLTLDQSKQNFANQSGPWFRVIVVGDDSLLFTNVDVKISDLEDHFRACGFRPKTVQREQKLVGSVLTFPDAEFCSGYFLPVSRSNLSDTFVLTTRPGRELIKIGYVFDKPEFLSPRHQLRAMRDYATQYGVAMSKRSSHVPILRSIAKMLTNTSLPDDPPKRYVYDFANPYSISGSKQTFEANNNTYCFFQQRYGLDMKTIEQTERIISSYKFVPKLNGDDPKFYLLDAVVAIIRADVESASSYRPTPSVVRFVNQQSDLNVARDASRRYVSLNQALSSARETVLSQFAPVKVQAVARPPESGSGKRETPECKRPQKEASGPSNLLWTLGFHHPAAYFLSLPLQVLLQLYLPFSWFVFKVYECSLGAPVYTLIPYMDVIYDMTRSDLHTWLPNDWTFRCDHFKFRYSRIRRKNHFRIFMHIAVLLALFSTQDVSPLFRHLGIPPHNEVSPLTDYETKFCSLLPSECARSDSLCRELIDYSHDLITKLSRRHDIPNCSQLSDFVAAHYQHRRLQDVLAMPVRKTPASAGVLHPFRDSCPIELMAPTTLKSNQIFSTHTMSQPKYKTVELKQKPKDKTVVQKVVSDVKRVVKDVSNTVKDSVNTVEDVAKAVSKYLPIRLRQVGRSKPHGQLTREPYYKNRGQILYSTNTFGTQMTTVRPRRTTRIRDTDFCFYMKSTTNFSAIECDQINPGNPSYFPWFHKTANTYMSYRINRLQFEWVPQMSNVSTSLNIGSMMCGWVTELNTSAPYSASSATALGLTQFSPLKPMKFDLPIKDCIRGAGNYNVTYGNAQTDSEPYMDYPAKFFICTNGFPTGNVSVGFWQVHYDVTLINKNDSDVSHQWFYRGTSAIYSTWDMVIGRINSSLGVNTSHYSVDSSLFSSSEPISLQISAYNGITPVSGGSGTVTDIYYGFDFTPHVGSTFMVTINLPFAYTTGSSAFYPSATLDKGTAGSEYWAVADPNVYVNRVNSTYYGNSSITSTASSNQMSTIVFVCKPDRTYPLWRLHISNTSGNFAVGSSTVSPFIFITGVTPSLLVHPNLTKTVVEEKQEEKKLNTDSLSTSTSSLLSSSQSSSSSTSLTSSSSSSVPYSQLNEEYVVVRQPSTTRVDERLKR